MVFIFSLLLLAGLFAGQVFNLAHFHNSISFVTSLCLSYIMIEVGLEFSSEKRSLSSYGWDSLIASGAAILPALLWFGYFMFVTDTAWSSALLAGLSSAPTSAGVLFAMLSAAGLGATWVFQKARVLAVLDDLVTILLLTSLVIVIYGFEWKSIITLSLIAFFIIASFRWQNMLNLPAGRVWLLVYALVLTAVVATIRNIAHIHLEVLIPAFMLGCLLYVPHGHHEKSEPSGPGLPLDTFADVPPLLDSALILPYSSSKLPDTPVSAVLSAAANWGMWILAALRSVTLW